jgi:hypothetical protein
MPLGKHCQVDHQATTALVIFEASLSAATRSLSPGIRVWLDRAMSSGWHRLGAGFYDGGPGGAMCPIAAAATMAGIWNDGAIDGGNPEWGTHDGPSGPVEEFVAYFDLCSEDGGIESAISTVRRALCVQEGESRAA